MDAVTMTRVMKELMKLLQNTSTSGEHYNYVIVEYKVAELKKALGSWFIEDCQLYVGS